MSSAHLLQRVGNGGLLEFPGVGFLASTRVPPELWLPTLDLVTTLGRMGTLLIGGFHSSLERDAYEVALAVGGNVVRIAAAPVGKGAQSKLERVALADGRLLLLSPAGGVRRLTARATEIRTQHVLQLAKALFIPAAPPRSRTYQAAAHVMARGLTACCFDHPRNTDLQILGVLGLDPRSDSVKLARALSGGSLNPAP